MTHADKLRAAIRRGRRELWRTARWSLGGVACSAAGYGLALALPGDWSLLGLAAFPPAAWMLVMSGRTPPPDPPHVVPAPGP